MFPLSASPPEMCCINPDMRRQRCMLACMSLPAYGRVSVMSTNLHSRCKVRMPPRIAKAACSEAILLYTVAPGNSITVRSLLLFLRKEVIQPHLPIRLPCYDFTPVISPAVDSSFRIGQVTGFGRCWLPWCDGRCVQDPGTYSP